MLLGAAVLTALVLGLVAWGFRAPVAQPRDYRFWALGMGVGLPLVVLTILVGTGLWMGERMQVKAGAEAVQVHAQARQWAWRFAQPNGQGRIVQTDDVLYIPAGQEVHVHITSEDVIHSFWVPRLAGKMDAIPGHPNVLRLQAHEPGRYDGLSAEFSGTGYADMRFAVVAYAPGQWPAALQAAPVVDKLSEGGS